MILMMSFFHHSWGLHTNHMIRVGINPVKDTGEHNTGAVMALQCNVNQ